MFAMFGANMYTAVSCVLYDFRLAVQLVLCSIYVVNLISKIRLS